MAYRSSAANSAVAGNNTATPAGTAAGDYLCGVMICDSQTPGVTPPTGWTTRVTVTNTAPDGQTMVFADKVAAGGDSFQWNNTSGNSMVIAAAFSGRNQTSPRTAITGEKNESTNTDSFTVSHTGLTAATGDDIAVFMQIDEVTGSDTWDLAQITNYTERQDNVASQSFVHGAALDTRDNVSAGATGALSSATTCLTRPGVGTGGWSVIAVAIAIAGTVDNSQIGAAVTQLTSGGKMIGLRYV
jgi:CBS-domain-containing membrane protein